MTSTTSSQAMLNHHHHQQQQQPGLFEDHDQDQDQMCAQMGFYSFPPNNNNNNNLGLPPLTSSSSPSSSSCHQSLKNFTILPSTTNNNLHETLLVSSSASPKQHLIVSSDHLQRSSANLWTWEGVNHEGLLGNNNIKRGGGDRINNQYEDDQSKINKIGVSAMNMKMKKMKATRRKVREPRFSFKTMSDVDVLDDGYKWRKYGQKVVKNTRHPRSYYRCTKDSCRVKKRVERLAEDPRMVITTYEGRHAHSPSHDLEASHSPSHLNNFFC